MVEKKKKGGNERRGKANWSRNGSEGLEGMREIERFQTEQGGSMAFIRFFCIFAFPSPAFSYFLHDCLSLQFLSFSIAKETSFLRGNSVEEARSGLSPISAFSHSLPPCSSPPALSL